MSALRVTRFTSDTGPLTKGFSLDLEGELKKSTFATLSRGRVENLTFANFDQFLEALPALQHNKVLAYGVSLPGDGQICAEERWIEFGRPASMWPRNRDHFAWPSGSGILMLDYDPPKSDAALEREQLLETLYGVVPELRKAAHAWWPSTSSCIYKDGTNEELTGIRGQRVYVWVAEAEDIPRAGKVLAQRLWLAGHGRYAVSKSGSLLPRTLVDAAVWQPEHLDFAAGAKCETPLVQQRGLPMRMGGDAPFDTRAILDLSDAETDHLARAEATAKAMVKDEAATKRVTWAGTTAATLQSKRGLAEEAAREVAREAVESGRLMGDFPLIAADGTEVSVGDILDDRSTWHAQRFHDPLEPDYPDNRIAWVNLFSGGRPYLHSHAHGGCHYELCRAVDTVTVSAGSTADATERTLALMEQDGGYYERAGTIVTLTERGEVRTPGPYALKQRLERFIRFQKYDGRAKELRPADCPDEIVRRILDSKGETPFRPLGGVVLYPTMTATGRLIAKPGYDPDTGLVLLTPDGRTWPKISETPSELEVIEALARLWAPVALFPFADATSRGVTLAALLTAPVRRGLRTAPAFLFAAPSAGAGKTLLAECVVALAGGATLQTLPKGDPELQKVLVSVLRMGPGALFFDNVEGTVSSKELNAMLTSPVFGGRILGVSEMAGSLPTNLLVVLTGNNARPVGDTCRRMLVATINPKVEQPFLREFPFNARDRVHAERMDLVVAALTILRGWKASGGAGKARGGELASFEEWDRLVRRAVIWVGEIERRVRGADAVGYDDPVANVAAQCAADDENEALGDLLEIWASEQDGKGFKALELYSALDRARSDSAWCGSGGVAALGCLLRDLLPNARGSLGVSRWLRGLAGRVVRGRFLEGVEDKVANNKSWQVRRLAS